ncbi:hypothetical protein ACE01N_03365 [Saccharicrinis sp. FJH2]|uniref:hypothetical protein n=1 Tax=Saccharicrinis sp. FJH65 TaxID=3344659 RepID=UPI0035F4BF15
MKKLFMLLILMVVISSCKKKSPVSFGFDSDINTNSSGLTLMDVDKGADLISLTGSVVVHTESVEVILSDPAGAEVYKNSFAGPETFSINETFSAAQGTWKLQYTSNNATGSIDLHMSYTN